MKFLIKMECVWKSVRTMNRIMGWGLLALMFTVWCSRGQPDSLAQSGETVKPPQKLVQARSEVERGKKDIQPGKVQSLPEIVAGLTPAGWEIFDKVMKFTAENLYEQIDGRAEFFLAYDVISMIFASFINRADTGQFIDLSIYDMGTPTNAFGVYSLERSQGEPSLDLGRTGYRSDANYYIWKGQYYIKVIASDATVELQRIGMGLARKVSALLLDSGETVWGMTALPQTDRVPESVQYFKVDAMGLDFMQNTYTAKYRKGGTVVTIFLSQRDSPESAQAAVAGYAKYARQYGKGVDRVTVKGVDLVSCDMGGSYDVLFQKGRQMGGVSSVADRSLAIQVAIDLWTRLRQE